ncbi:phage tail protein [Lacticaseibacillus casei]|nr:phage tail protein [Lacticaseibacillus casei]
MKQAGVTITYAGVDITQWMYVQMVERDVGTNHVNTMQKVGISDGQMLQYMSRDVKTIVVTGIVMNDNLVPLRRSLAAAIDADEPQQLIFGDEPDKYYLAIVDSQPTFTEGFRSGTISISFICPDGGIAHSVATKTADNMPYKDVPVNFAIASHASGSNTTSKDAYPIHMQLSEDLSGKTITTVAKVIVTNYQGKVDSTNSMGPYIDVKDGLSTGIWAGLINQIPITGNGVYTSSPRTIAKNSLTGTANQIDVEMYNLNATIEVWIKLELGTTASPWSPNPADPEYYTNTITVHNGGTYPVEPVITATMHADNGLIAFINSQGGVLQFGNPEEADGVERQRSEVARYEGFDKEPVGAAYNTGQTNSHYYYIAAQKNVMEGSVKYADDDGSAVEPVFLPTNSYYWEGPSVHLKTTNASNGSNTGSFIAKWRYKFNSNVSALGAIEMTLDNDTGVAYEVIIRANYAGKDDVDVQVFAGSTLVFQQTLNRSVFSNGRYYEAKLTKLGNTLNLQLAGIVQGGIKPSEVITRNPPLIMPPIMLTSDEASLPITGVTLWFQRFENYPYPDMGVYDMDIEWLNVDYWTDLKNRFGAGDVVTIDVANRAVYVNGVPDSTLHTIGNEWSKFRFNPGDTLIQMVPSSWAQPFACEVDLREAWL